MPTLNGENKIRNTNWMSHKQWTDSLFEKEFGVPGASATDHEWLEYIRDRNHLVPNGFLAKTVSPDVNSFVGKFFFSFLLLVAYYLFFAFFIFLEQRMLRGFFFCFVSLWSFLSFSFS